MNIDQLLYMIAIATAGSLSAAAKQVGVTQQALSKYLAEEEAEAGLELFFRSKRKYLPTPAGHQYIEAAQQILELRQHTVNALAAMQGRPPRPLRLGVSPNRGIELLSQIYPIFERRYPQVQLAVTEGYANDLQDQLLQGRLDAVVTGQIGAAPSCRMLSIHSEELVLAVPSFHPLVKHSTARLEELPFAELQSFEDALFIQPRLSSNMHGLLQSLFDAENFHPRVATSLPNIRMQLAMVRAGTHVALLPSYYVRPDPAVAFFRLHNSPRMTMAYMTRTGHELSEVERYLIWLMIASKLRETDTGILWNDELRASCSEFGSVDMGGFL